LKKSPCFLTEWNRAHTKKVNNEYEVTLNTVTEKYWADSLGKEQPIPVNDYIDLAVFGADNTDAESEKVILMKRLKIRGRQNKFVFRVKELPLKVGIDPYNYLVDRIPDDNVKTISND